MLKLFTSHLFIFRCFRTSYLPPAYLYQKDERAPHMKFDSSKYLSPFLLKMYCLLLHSSSFFVLILIVFSSVRCASLTVYN